MAQHASDMKVQLLQENCKKNKNSMNHLQHLKKQLFWVVTLCQWAGLLHPEDEGIIILQSIGKYLSSNTA